MVENIFQAMEAVMTKCKGGYAGLYLINGVGLVGFRDPHGIRPMVFGSRKSPRFETRSLMPRECPLHPREWPMNVPWTMSWPVSRSPLIHLDSSWFGTCSIVK